MPAKIGCMSAAREWKDLAGIGRAMLRDFEVVGVRTVKDLAASDPNELYERLCALTGARHDICCLDVFRCAVAQARHPDLPEEQKNWWYWSRKRKAAKSGSNLGRPPRAEKSARERNVAGHPQIFARVK